MSKFNVAFNVDLANILPVSDGGHRSSQEQASEAVRSLILAGARAQAKAKLQEIRIESESDQDVKMVKMAEQLRIMMFTLMAEANLVVSEISPDTEIQTKLPFELAEAA